MSVKELIYELQGLANQEAEVVFFDGNFTDAGKVSVSYVRVSGSDRCFPNGHVELEP